MSAPASDEWPEIGEIIVASVRNVTSYGAYVELEEYGKEGFLHISEISSSWVKNIRHFVREGEKTVLKVLRVNSSKKHIDLSLRRITKRERTQKLRLWKQNRKTETLLRSTAEKLGKSFEEIDREVRIPLEKKFTTVHEGLEKTAEEGSHVLLEQGIPREISEILAEIAKDKIRIKKVRINGILKITCPKNNGILEIKKSLSKAESVKNKPGTEVRIYLISPPRYRLEVTAGDYKEANNTIKKATQAALNSIEKSGGKGSFERG